MCENIDRLMERYEGEIAAILIEDEEKLDLEEVALGRLRDDLRQRLTLLNNEIADDLEDYEFYDLYKVESTKADVLVQAKTSYVTFLTQLFRNILEDWDEITQVFITEDDISMIRLVSIKKLGDETHNNFRCTYKLFFELSNGQVLRLVYKPRDMQAELLLMGDTRIVNTMLHQDHRRASLIEQYNTLLKDIGYCETVQFLLDDEPSDPYVVHKPKTLDGGLTLAKIQDVIDNRYDYMLPTIKILPSHVLQLCQEERFYSIEFPYGYMEYISRKDDAVELDLDYQSIKHVHQDHPYWNGMQPFSDVSENQIVPLSADQRIVKYLTQILVVKEFIGAVGLHDIHHENLIYTKHGMHLIDAECFNAGRGSEEQYLREVKHEVYHGDRLQKWALLVQEGRNVQVVDPDSLLRGAPGYTEIKAKRKTASVYLMNLPECKELFRQFKKFLSTLTTRELFHNTGNLVTITNTYRTEGYRNMVLKVNSYDMMKAKKYLFSPDLRMGMLIGDIPAFYSNAERGVFFYSIHDWYVS